MDRDNYENEFSSLLDEDTSLRGENRQRTSGGKLRYSSNCDAGAQWKAE